MDKIKNIRFIIIPVILALLMVSSVSAKVPDDCKISDGVVAEVRLFLTAEDNVPFFDYWTNEELVCAAIILFYNDPEDAFLHDRVITGAVVLMGMTEDLRAVPVLIDAIDKYPAQALYNLGNFSTVAALNALTDHVRSDDYEARDNVAEGLRRMQSPSASKMESGWIDALNRAISEVEKWIPLEPEYDIKEYYVEALANLKDLRQAAMSVSGTN